MGQASTTAKMGNRGEVTVRRQRAEKRGEKARQLATVAYPL